MKCPSCHKEISEDCEFCPFCGKKIVKELICPKCHTSNDISFLYCKKCGASLKETTEAKPNQNGETNKPKKGLSKSFNNVLEIVAMGLTFLAFGFLLGFVFCPFLFDAFFPSDDTTIISWISDVFKNFNTLIEDQQYIKIVNVFIVLVLFVSFSILAVLFIAINIPKLIKAIKEKTFYDFSRFLIILYLIFIALFVYFAKYVLNTDRAVLEAFGGAPIFVLVFTPIVLAFNFLVKTLAIEKKDVRSIIFDSILIVVAFVFLTITIFNLGDGFFSITGIYRVIGTVDTTASFRAQVVNMDVYSTFMAVANNYYSNAYDIVASFTVCSLIAFALEIILLASCLMLLNHLFRNYPTKRINLSYGIVLSTISLALAIAALVLNQKTNDSINQINDMNLYNGKLISSFDNSHNVAVIVMLSLVLVLFVTALVLDSRKNKKAENE